MDLGLTTEEFYLLTPRQLDALTRRHAEQVRSNEFLFGQLTSAVVNFSMCHPEKPSEIRDFMPSEMRKAVVKPKRRARKVIAAEVRGFFDLMMKKQAA